jgi:hypothetical protein
VHSIGPRTIFCHAWPAEKPRGPWPGGPVQRGKWSAPGDVARARQHGDTLAVGPVAASRWQGAAGKHQWDPEVGSGKEEGAEAHQRGGPTARWRKRLWAAAFNGGGGALVAGGDEGVALQLRGEREGEATP